MDVPPSRHSPQSQSSKPNQTSSSMSALTMRPSSVLPSPKHLLWEDTRPLELPSRPRSPTERTEKVELPSIRQVCSSTSISKNDVDLLQAIPEIQLQPNRGSEGEYRTDSNSYSPSAGPGAPEYVRSPSQRKRRRLSADDNNDPVSRDHIVPRTYRSPSRTSQTPNIVTSPTSSTRGASTFSRAKSWTGSARTSPYIPKQSPPPFDSASINRAEWRPTLPSLQSLTLDRGGQIQAPRGRSNWSEYALEPTRSEALTYPQLAASFEPPPSYDHPPFSYGHQQPRGQSYSGPSSLSFDQTPFLAVHHHPSYPRSTHPYGIDINDGSDGKQRKRRGNLPKETTDKLRAWFVAHLQHPYPTEDEKQELMRQTGLQMSKYLV